MTWDPERIYTQLLAEQEKPDPAWLTGELYASPLARRIVWGLLLILAIALTVVFA